MSLRLSEEHFKISAKEAKWTCDLSKFKFKDTSSIKPVKGIIGQERALKALKLGVEMRVHGYNIFITGLSGTGKFTTVKEMLENLRPECPILSDYAYVNNFSDPDRPLLLMFEAGGARKFKDALNSTIKFLLQQIPKVLESKQYLSKQKKIILSFQEIQSNILGEFQNKLENNNFTLGSVKVGDTSRPEIMTVIDNEPYYIQQLDELVKNKKVTSRKAKSILKNYTSYHQELQTIIQKSLDLNQQLQDEIKELERESVAYIVEGSIKSLKNKYDKNEKVIKFLESIQESIFQNLDIFKGKTEEEFQEGDKVYVIDYLKDYSVNIILDNSNVKDCPVIIETSPSFTNLFGTIEKYSDGYGGWHADFTRIKAGSILRANGGYLVINAMDAFNEPGIWNTLKRVLLYGKLEIQDTASFYHFSPSVLKPEPIEINTKIIFIGNNYIYSMLSGYESDFNKIFKVKAEFDYEINRTNELLKEYLSVIKKIIDKEGLLEFNKKGIQKVLEYSARYAGRKDKLTTRFAYIADLIREASFWAKSSGKKIVTDVHVKQAFELSRERHNLYESKVNEMFAKDIMLIDVKGERVGQINGLAVYGNGKYSFGKPSRITAAVSLGNGNIINVERESGLSGSTHNKGILIISGYFRETFGKNFPLSFTASIVFEQGYGPIDGDSASVTEVCALLSCLSEIPIKQKFAITGSVNQKGDIQPIGGVNEKIEGFFDICKMKKSSDNGVIIPYQNLDDLMLKDEVCNAIEDGEFHIYPIKRVEEAIEILTGVQAGKLNKNGHFQANTVYGLVEKRLREMREKIKPTSHRSTKKTGNKK